MDEALKPKVNIINYKTASLEMYQNEVLEIWPTNMSGRPPLYIWLHVVRHAAAACEGVRKNEWKTILDELGALVLWWLAFISKSNRLARSKGDDVIFALPFTASQVVWNKYPRVCPVEFGLNAVNHRNASWDELWKETADLECTCLARKKEVENRNSAEKAYARDRLHIFAHEFSRRRPKGLGGFEEVFRHIFSGSTYTLTPNEIAFHLMEEVGEVSAALADLEVSQTVLKNYRTKRMDFKQERGHRVLELSGELADVFSWTISLINKVRLLLSSFDEYFNAVPGMEAETLANIKALLGHDANKINICDIIWRKYGIGDRLRCPICGNRPCNCYVENQKLLIGEGIEPWIRKSIRAVDTELRKSQLISPASRSIGKKKRKIHG